MPGEITPEMLRRLIDYDPETGEMRWRRLSAEVFDGVRRYRGGADARAKEWNSRKAGQDVVIAMGGGSYGIMTRAFGVRINLHVTKVAFALAYGRWPKGTVSFADGDSANTSAKNMSDGHKHPTGLNPGTPKTSKPTVKNTSGRRGVDYVKPTGRWRVHIGVNGKKVYVGTFDTFEEAVSSREAAEKKYGYTNAD